MSKQTDWPYVINLGNSIIGVSVLAMPFCFKQCGLLLGMLLLLGSAFLTHIACNLLLKGAMSAKKRSYEFLALHIFGPAGKLAVEVSIIGVLIGTCIAFHVVIGDLGPAIISRILGIENTPQLRTFVMVFLGLFVGLPLGLLKNVESLSNISAVSLGFYSVFVAEVFTTAFPNLWSGVWVTKVEMWKPEGVFRCLPIFSLAFGCQSQLFIIYDCLPEPSLSRMTSITKNAISLCTSVYLCVGYFGYVAFCEEEISGDILMNFRPTIFSEAVKLGFVLSVAVSFPLVIFPCRSSIHTLLFAKNASPHDSFSGSMHIPEPYFKLITTAIVVSTLVVGVYVPNIEFVLALTGATMGSMICFIFPAIMFITLMSMHKSGNKSKAQVVLFLGVTILLASTYVTLNSQDKAQSGQASVVKIAVPDAADDLAVVPDDMVPDADEARKGVDSIVLKKDGDDVIKDEAKLTGDKKKEDKVEDQVKLDVEDHRHEPPNPHAPPDADPGKAEAGKDTKKKKVPTATLR